MHMWQEQYKDKIISADKASAMIKSGDRIMSGNRDARAILRRLIHREDLRDVYYYAPIVNWMEDSANMGKGFRPSTSFLNDSTWQLHREGKLDYIPGEYWTYESVATKSLKCNVALIAISAPDKNGYVSLSSCADFIRIGCKKADLVIGEINPDFSFVYGSNVMHISEFNYIVTDGEAADFCSPPLDDDPENLETYKSIGASLSELIPNEATIEVGLGRLNSCAMMYLEGVRDLGIHTEIYGDAMRELTNRSIITNEYKSLKKGKSVYTQMSGTRDLFKWADHNLQLELSPCQEVVNPNVIYSQHRMTAINNAVEIDLLGQANSEYLKGYQYSGTGGIVNFASAATAHPEGKSIVVLESITKNGKLSKIKPFLSPGTPVSLNRNVIEYVVTEQGIARLGGKSPTSRVKELIKVAHPKFREELEFEAKKLNLI